MGAVILSSFIYFYEGGGWNQNSRFDLLRAIVEKHTLRIDAYRENTQDDAHLQRPLLFGQSTGTGVSGRACGGGSEARATNGGSRS